MNNNLEPRYKGYENYSKAEYLAVLNDFLKQENSDLTFQMPPKLQQSISSPVDVENKVNVNTQFIDHDQSLKPQFILDENNLPEYSDYELPQHHIPIDEINIPNVGEADQLIRRFDLDKKQDDQDCKICCGIALPALISAGFIGAIFLYRGNDYFNTNFQAMALQATKDIANNCSYNPTMFQKNPVPLETAYHINNFAWISSGIFSFALMTAAYVSISAYGITGKLRYLTKATSLIGALTTALVILNELNERIWMPCRGQAAGYNSEYTHRCYNSSAYQHCRNVTPVQCDLGLNGIPISYFDPFENQMAVYGWDDRHPANTFGYSFFTGIGALSTLIILNSIYITALYVFSRLNRRQDVAPFANDNQGNVNNDDQRLYQRRGYGAV